MLTFVPWWCALSLCIYFQEINTWIYSLFTDLLEPTDFFAVVNPKILYMTKKWKGRNKKIVKLVIFKDTEFYKLCITIVNG